MTTISFTIDTQPLPKQRPRVVNGRAYTAKETREYENHVAWLARIAMGERPPLAGPLVLEVQFRRTGKRTADLDNLIKAVTDAMNGIVYADDQQVRTLLACVIYSVDDPGARVMVRET